MPGALSSNANEDGMKLLLEHEMLHQQNWKTQSVCVLDV